MDPAAAYELYRRKVEAHAPLDSNDDPLFAKMRAEDKQANLRLVMGVSRWVVERIDRIPSDVRAAKQLDHLTLLQGANGVVARAMREYKGTSVSEFRSLLDAALEVHFTTVLQ